MNGHQSTEALREAIRELAARPDGFRCRDVMKLGYAQRAVDNAVSRGLISGLLHKVKVSHRMVFYFADAKEAMKRQAEAMTVKVAPPKTKSTAHWPKDAQPYFPTNPDGTPAYRITIAPKPVHALRTNTYQA